MQLEVNIHHVKCIDDLSVKLPLEPALYAITGKNGSGKSTIVTCASSVFFDLKKDDYFGITPEDSYIKYSVNGKTKCWQKDTSNNWISDNNSSIGLMGFYEGSLIYGNRFRDTTIEKLHELEHINIDKLEPASDFIRKNLGMILQGDENYYDKLLKVPHDSKMFNRTFYYYEKNGKLVSQFHMSTGENLLVSILNSLFLKNKQHVKKAKFHYDKYQGKVIFLDEIELALHPSSLRRLVQFLEDMSSQYGYAIYFSTHSIELVGCIKPENLYYVDRHADNSTEIINPCYPAFATRNLFNRHDGYDKVILVEDELARCIINRLLKEKRLLESRLVHVLPCGGYTHVIDFADDVICNNLLGNKTSICMVLDRDVKKDALAYKKSKSITSVPVSFLPVPSLEKYLRNVLYINVDHQLHRLLGNYIFQQKSLTDLIEEYKKDKGASDDEKGKLLYRYLKDEMLQRRKNRDNLIEIIVDYWFDNKSKEFEELCAFLVKELPS